MKHIKTFESRSHDETIGLPSKSINESVEPKTLNVDCCRHCPFYDGSDRECARCMHKDGLTGYEHCLSRSHNGPDPIPRWCPIKDGGGVKVKRNANDEIISITNINIVGRIE